MIQFTKRADTTRSALFTHLREDLREGQLPAGYHAGAVNSVVLGEDADFLERAVDRCCSTFRVGDEHHPAAGLEPGEGLLDNLRVPVVRETTSTTR